MEKAKKHLSKEMKLQIIREASIHGVKRTLAKYGIYPASYYSWKKKLAEMGEAGLEHSMTKERLKRIQELEQENELLKQLLAEKELESKLKDELLKKKYSKLRKKYL